MDTQQLTILIKALDHSTDHAQQLSGRALAIQTWIGSIFLGVIGGIIALGPNKLSEFGTNVQILLTIAVISLCFFGWITEVLTFKARIVAQHSKIKILRLLHLFEKDSFGEHSEIYEESNWVDWTNSLPRKIGTTPATAILFILASVVIALIWIA